MENEKLCPNCESKVREGDAFCASCGLNLKESVIDEEQSEVQNERNRKVMKKLAKFTFNELLNRGVPPEKIKVIREDLKHEFESGEIKELPMLLKDCSFQYLPKDDYDREEKKIVCALAHGKVRCMKEICPVYRSGHLGR